MTSDKFIRVLIAFVLLSAAAGLLPACAPPRTVTADGIRVDITQNSSGAAKQLIKRLDQEFMLKYPAIYIANAGDNPIEGCCGGIVDVGAISRELPHGPDRVLQRRLLARDGIAVIVNPSQVIERLTVDEVSGIFAGTIDNWQQVGGGDARIRVVATDKYEQGASGSGDMPQDLVLHGGHISDSAIYRLSEWGMPFEAMRFTVANDPDAIGFLPFGSLTNEVKPLIIDNIPPTVANIKNGTYPYIIPLYLIQRNPTHELPNKFIEYCLSDEGQLIVRETGFLTIDFH